MIPSHRPSLQGRFTLIWSGDSALQPRPEDEKLAREWDRLLEHGRETGDWSKLLKDGDAPTLFRFEFPQGTSKRKLLDLIGRLVGSGENELVALFFRATVREVTNLGDFKIRIGKDAATGLDMASDDVVALLDEINPTIVPELAGICLARFARPPGK